LVSRINKKENIAELLKIVYKFLFIVPFSIALVFAFHFEEFILIIFGNEYIESGLPTAIIISTQVFLFFNFFSLDLFTALSKQKYNFYYAFLIVLINVLLNFLLIPKYDYLGAAYSKIITSFVGTIFIVVILSKLKVDFNFINKKMLISLLILAILLYFASFLNIFAYLLISLILILISNRYNWLFDSKELLLIAKLFRAEKLFKKLFKINLD
jgi:O-antigen/teichoic acid export membrane protein